MEILQDATPVSRIRSCFFFWSSLLNQMFCFCSVFWNMLSHLHLFRELLFTNGIPGFLQTESLAFRKRNPWHKYQTCLVRMYLTQREPQRRLLAASASPSVLLQSVSVLFTFCRWRAFGRHTA